MKKASVLLIGMMMFLTGVVYTLDDIQITRVNVPRDFVHEGKDFAKGNYRVTLTEKEGTAVFLVKNMQDELLFEELAVIKPYEGKSRNFKPRISRVVLKGYEYYRVKVTTPESVYMLYFLLKNNG